MQAQCQHEPNVCMCNLLMSVCSRSLSALTHREYELQSQATDTWLFSSSISRSCFLEVPGMVHDVLALTHARAESRPCLASHSTNTLPLVASWMWNPILQNLFFSQFWKPCFIFPERFLDSIFVPWNPLALYSLVQVFSWNLHLFHVLFVSVMCYLSKDISK